MVTLHISCTMNDYFFFYSYSGIPAGCKVDDVPPDVIDQLNRSHMHQPYVMMDHPGRTNILHHPMMIDHTNRPISILQA